jgi:hypothetical protein
LLILKDGNDIFQNKNNTHPGWALVATQKVSAQNNKVSSLRGGKLLAVFGSWNPKNP